MTLNIALVCSHYIKFTIKVYVLLSLAESTQRGTAREDPRTSPQNGEVPWHVLIRGLSCECYDYCSLESFEWELARHD